MENTNRNVPAKKSRLKWIIVGALGLPLIAMVMVRSGPLKTASNAYVRVNQIGYEAGQPMRAYIMAGAPQAGNKFSVKKADRDAVLSAALGSPAGTWGKYTIYPLDFTVSSAGSYTVEVSGATSAVSPSFPVDIPENIYSGALHNALEFYQAQRDGEDYIPSALRRAPAHLNDKHGKVYESPKFGWFGRIKGDLRPTGGVADVSGGWSDAGDYLKFVETTSYVEALMLVGVRDFPKQMGGGSRDSNFTKEAKFGLDWLQRMWDDKSKTLYYQVGIGSGNFGFENDHSVWRLPEADDAYGGTDAKFRYIRNRPVLIAGPAGSKISPNLAGRLSADFALCYRIYRDTEADYANQCLLAAQHIFDLADTSPGGELLTAAPHEFYPESEWRDDMEFGATEMYLAMRGVKLPDGLPHAEAMFYLQAAASWASAYIRAQKDGGETLNLYDVSGLAHFELYRAIALAKNPSGLAASLADLLGNLQKKLDGAAAQAGKDSFGFGRPWGTGDTAAHGAGLSLMASEYDFLMHSDKYASYSSGWIGNILGANAWGSSFIVGDGSTFPHCIHHQVANLIGSQDGQPPVLAGAVVAGPNRNADSGAPRGVAACPPDGKDGFARFNGNDAVYLDNVEFYSTVEPAIDLTAPSFLMFAWRAAGAPSAFH
jgi:endoglucanase